MIPWSHIILVYPFNLMVGIAERCSELLNASFLALYLGHQENLQAFLRRYSDFFFTSKLLLDCHRLLQIVLASKKQFKSLEFFKRYGNLQTGFPGWEKVVRQVSKN